jgi:GH24 family phage-related lysozyme (muramidase)
MSIDYARAQLLLQPSEGYVPHMYLDTKALVTVGIGNMLPAVDAAQALRFIDRTTQNQASLQAIESDFVAVTKQPGARPARYYRQFTALDLPNVEIDALFRARVDSFVAELRQAYSKFDSFPDSAQLALLDMAFNLGTNGLKKKFPKLNAAIDAQDWIGVAAESNRPDVNSVRNAAVKNLFTAAANESK